MIDYISDRNIDKEKWDKLVLKSTNPHIYMLSWYLDITCPSWKALIWEDYRAAMPLNIKKFIFFKYLPPPLLSQQTGLIFTPGFDYTEALNGFFSSGLFRNLVKFRYNFHSGISFKNVTLVKRSDLEIRKNYFIELNLPYNILYQSFNDNRKRNLRKAKSQGWYCKPGNNAEVMIEMYKNNQALKQKDLKGTYLIVAEIFKECRKRNMAEIITCVDSKGEEIAHGFFAKFERRVYYLFGTMNERGKKHSALSLILNSVIEKYAESDVRLDFEGGNLQNIGAYFASFGAIAEDYCCVTKKLL